MTMRLTLDRPAMQLLIDRDPEFEVKLQKAILSEIGKRVLSKDANKIIAQAEPELFAKVLRGLQDDEDLTKLVQGALEKQLVIRDGTWSQYVKPSEATKKAVDTHVTAVTERVLREATNTIDAAFGNLVKAKLGEALAQDDIESRIEKRLNWLVDQEVNKRADEKFKQRMADLKSMIA